MATRSNKALLTLTSSITDGNKDTETILKKLIQMIICTEQTTSSSANMLGKLFDERQFTGQDSDRAMDVDKVMRIVELLTWLEHQGHRGKKFIDLYKSITGTHKPKDDKLKLFYQSCLSRVDRAHRDEEVPVVADYLFTAPEMTKFTKGEMSIDEAVITVMRKLLKYTSFRLYPKQTQQIAILLCAVLMDSSELVNAISEHIKDPNSKTEQIICVLNCMDSIQLAKWSDVLSKSQSIR